MYLGFKKVVIFLFLFWTFVFQNSFINIVLAQETISEPTPTPVESSIPENTTLLAEPTEAPSENTDQIVEILPTEIPQVIESTPTPTPTVVETTNEAEITDNLVVNSNTGENVVDIATPSPLPLPTDDPNNNLTQTSLPTETNTNSSNSQDQQTSAPSPSPSPEATSLSTNNLDVDNANNIKTGDSYSVTNIENNINANFVNSVFEYQTLNIYLPSDIGDIDLSKLTENAVNKVFSNDKNEDNQINLTALSIDNFVYLENNVNQISDTGNNTIDESKVENNIKTGDAYSIVTVLNNLNTNIINSRFILVTINIFTDYQGNIILPSLDEEDNNDSCCGEININTNNNASVVNNLTSITNTGNNTINAVEGGQIETGNAESVINVFNLVNTNYIGVTFKNFTINTFGEWIGDFLGWDDISVNENDNLKIDEQNTNNSNLVTPCSNCSLNTDIKNSAILKNNINSFANTGNNYLGSKYGQINTGNSYSSISVFNFVNSNIFNSTGFVGFINIFGKLVGDVGDSESFEEDVVISDDDVTNNQESQNQTFFEDGGKIELIANHNVGEFVYPGDTITFQAKVKNIGTGKLYDNLLTIQILKNNVVVGLAQFNLGEIQSGRSKSLSTGLKISDSAQSGYYQTKVIANAKVGNNQDLISSEVNDQFLIKSKYLIASSNVASNEVNQNLLSNNPEVLGLYNNGDNLTFEEKMYFAFVLLLILLIILKLRQNKNMLLPIYQKAQNYARKISSLLSSLFA